MKKEDNKIDWALFTTEEINLKKIDLNNTYQMLHKMSLELLKEMDKIECEYNNANIELTNRGW